MGVQIFSKVDSPPQNVNLLLPKCIFSKYRFYLPLIEGVGICLEWTFMLKYARFRKKAKQTHFSTSLY